MPLEVFFHVVPHLVQLVTWLFYGKRDEWRWIGGWRLWCASASDAQIPTDILDTIALSSKNKIICENGLICKSPIPKLTLSLQIALSALSWHLNFETSHPSHDSITHHPLLSRIRKPLVAAGSSFQKQQRIISQHSIKASLLM